jgi:hypothetical protein
MKLGKLPPRIDPRTLKLANYLDPATLPPLLPSVNWSNAVSAAWGMMGNDRVGDCTCAGLGHIVMAVTANAGVMAVPSDAEILRMYEDIGGYRPGDSNTDKGATELDALLYISSTGLAGAMLDAFADVEAANLDYVKLAVQLFGSVYIGVQLTRFDIAQFEVGASWDVSTRDDGTVVGGHAVPILDFDARGGNCVTWGRLQPFTWAWFSARCDEVHAPLFFKWISDLGTSPSGLDLDRLERDVQAVRQ